ncbi:MAG: RNA polymerase sigma factor [Phycisphaerae bacterium]|nr:RNA polymerase sigma factor [Phycisphaerae bacterium]NIS54605.1 RNA polymerase sigma factor [Phycisphaerae bacterium]NIU12214.1 RNA polymerase sigma factor [Phycisphaerae bacterium]NIW96410.1 sigma-70 family RNA polymerase sigma factor [Phycisphaerae bacterium]
MQTELVEDALNGDIDSFGRLAARYYASMVAVAYAVLADHQLAEDAAQEAFARALTNLSKLRKPDKFAPWLARICRNVARDMVASRARMINPEDLSPAPNCNSPDDDLEAVRRAIEHLPVGAREVIVLRYYNGLSYEEISSVLGISKQTINGRLTRAKRKIAKYLKRSGFLEDRL